MMGLRSVRQSFFVSRAVHKAAIRRRNAFGFSVNSRLARRCAVFKWVTRRAAIAGVSRDRQGDSG